MDLEFTITSTLSVDLEVSDIPDTDTLRLDTTTSSVDFTGVTSCRGKYESQKIVKNAKIDRSCIYFCLVKQIT